MRDLGGKKANSVGVNMLSTSGHEKRIKMGGVGSPLGSGEAELLNSRHEHKGEGDKEKACVSMGGPRRLSPESNLGTDYPVKPITG